MSRRHQRYGQRYIADRYPLAPLSSAEAIYPARPMDAAELAALPDDAVLERPFEYRVITPATWTYNAQSSPTTKWLIGDESNAGVVQGFHVPARCRAFVDFISPYADTGCFWSHSGIPWTMPNMDNLTQAVWNIYVNGQPAGDYGVITEILNPWGGIADRPMIRLVSGDILTCSVSYTNYNNAIISNIGVRLKGWIVPYEMKGAEAGR